jgi:hypothetical protein
MPYAGKRLALRTVLYSSYAKPTFHKSYFSLSNTYSAINM